ncbi:MAG: helix-turn-helix domain-containing protein [Syntrophorhabdales bacterium]|jgi:excisionase family DNA binding protein
MTKEERKARVKELKTPKGPIKRLYTIPEAAFYLGRTSDAIYEMIWIGKIPYVKDGKRNLIDIRDMDEFIENNKTRFAF